MNSEILHPLYNGKPVPKKRGRPKIENFEDKSKDSQYREACEILEKYSPAAVFRAARLAAHRNKMTHANYILKKLEEEDDANSEAYELRKAEKFYKTHPSKQIQITNTKSNTIIVNITVSSYITVELLSQ